MDAETKNLIDIMVQRIDELERQVKDLSNFSTIPREVEEAFIKRGFLKYDGDIYYTGGAGGNVFREGIFKSTDKKMRISYTDFADLIPFSVNITTDTCYSVNHGLTDGEIIYFYTIGDGQTVGTLPGGLDSTVATYEVFNSTADTFQVSDDGGATAVNITSSGTGALYVSLT